MTVKVCPHCGGRIPSGDIYDTPNTPPPLRLFARLLIAVIVLIALTVAMSIGVRQVWRFINGINETPLANSIAPKAPISMSATAPSHKDAGATRVVSSTDRVVTLVGGRFSSYDLPAQYQLKQESGHSSRDDNRSGVEIEGGIGVADASFENKVDAGDAKIESTSQTARPLTITPPSADEIVPSDWDTALERERRRAEDELNIWCEAKGLKRIGLESDPAILNYNSCTMEFALRHKELLTETYAPLLERAKIPAQRSALALRALRLLEALERHLSQRGCDTYIGQDARLEFPKLSVRSKIEIALKSARDH